MAESVSSWLNMVGYGTLVAVAFGAYVFYDEYRRGTEFGIEFKDWDEIKPW
jgi:hypothetical protein